MTNESDSFIQEVDEKVRQDQLMSMLKRWGPWVLGAFLVTLAIVGAWQGYEYYRLNESRKASEVFSAATKQLQEGDLEAASESFERLSTQGPQIYRAMALMERGAIAQAQGELDDAMALFDDAAEAAKDPVAADTARIRAAYIAAETQDFPAVRARLEPMLESETPVRYLARELLGVEAWEAGEVDLARQTLEPITLALDAPETVRQRAERALAVIGPAPETTTTEAAPETPAGETE